MIGFIFQSYNLIPNLSAIQNVMLPMEFAGVSRTGGASGQRRSSIRSGWGAASRTAPGKLSGGEQQRVATPGRWPTDPKLILADEPTGNLDCKTGRVIVSLLHGLAAVRGHDHPRGDPRPVVARRTDMTFEMEDGKFVAGDDTEDLTGARVGA